MAISVVSTEAGPALPSDDLTALCCDGSLMTTEPIAFNKILVGIDDHDQARDAVSLAAALARTSGSELLVAAAIEYDPLPLGREFYDQARSEHFARLFSVAEEYVTGLAHRRFELDKAPGDALVELAQSELVDAVVIGSTHRGLMGRALHGTLADALVEHCGCPVIVAPHGYAGRGHAGFGSIAVGCDGSPSATRAIDFAENLAEAFDCELRIVGAVPTYDDAPDPLHATRESIYRERVAVGRRRVSRVPVSEAIEFGDAAQRLAHQGIDSDFIVVGSRGHGRLGRTVLGSVASRLVRLAPCPVVVVPGVLATEDTPDGRAPDGAEA
jgi:nucleotide-binding universal stress UspA family protein